MLNAVLIGITLMIILGMALLFHVVIKVTPEESFASAIMTILIMIYVTGVLGDTQVALWSVYVLSVIGLVIAIIRWMRKKPYSIRTFWSPGIVMLCGLTLFAVVVFKGMHVYNWDELYQWGKAANYMVEYDKLPTGDAFAGQSILLSSTTFFHYFMSNLSADVIGTVTESNYYVSNLLLWFSAIVLPFSDTGWKQWKRVFTFGVFHFLLTAIIFVQPYYNIYTDQATAYWAGALIAWLIIGKCKKRNVYLIPLILINVGLMKSMVGPLFAVIVMLVIVLVYIYSCKEAGNRFIPKNWPRILLSKKGLIGIACVLSPFILMGVWSLVTKQNGLFRFKSGALTQMEDDRITLTLKSMINWIFESVTLKDESIYLSYGIFIIITIALVNILYPLILDTKRMSRYTKIMNVYIIGFGLFFIVMFVAYITVFGYVDSTRAMSLNRYFSDYMMLGVVPLTLPLFMCSEEEQKPFVKAIKKTVIVIFTLCIIYGSSDYFLQNLVHAYAMDTKNYAERERMIKDCNKIKEITNEKGKVYFINQDKSGLFTLVADYEMDEQLSREGMCFNFREDTSEPINGLTEYSIDTLPDVLQEEGYSYVWVYSSNDYFATNMERLFGLEQVKSGDFYKVVVSDGVVRLKYMKYLK